jgi:hypothetical protein
MTYASDVNDLIQRYLWRVERRLPAAQAKDVVAELDSLLRDQLDAQAESMGKPADLGMTCAVLKTFGPPEEAASRYSASPRYLIGPAAFPIFLKVTKWVLGGMTLIILLQTILRAISDHSQSLGWICLSGIGAWYQSILFTMAWVVLIFAVMERTQFKGWPPKLDWDPLDLAELPGREEDKVTMAAMALEILGPFFLLMILNYFPKWAGVVMVTNAQVHVLHFSDLGFYLPMAWINVCLVMQILLNLAVLQTGQWNAGLHWAKVLLGFLGAGIVGWIIFHAVKPAPEAVEALAATAGIPSQILKLLLELAYGFGKVFPLLLLISPAKRTYRLLRDMGRTAR